MRADGTRQHGVRANQGICVNVAPTAIVAEKPCPPVGSARPASERARSRSVGVGLAMAAVFVAAIVWSYWPTLADLAERWVVDPQYSHGFLVPLFAAIILWVRRPVEKIGSVEPLGLLLLVVSLAPRWFTGRMDLGAVDAVCMLGAILGSVLFVGGRPLFRWMWVPILFLAFMIPLPFAVEEGVAMPLRHFATEAATYVLQTLGYPAVAEGNIIQIDQIRLGVIDACSGLGMLMTLFALAAALALVVRGPVVDRVILVASAIPIAILANMARITLTGVAYASFGWQQYHQTIHDVLGWFMMPLALVLLWTEYLYLQRLLVPATAAATFEVQTSPWLARKKR
jgi:exosortase